ncbi:glycine cleavage T C-terminal barrel domain-containing protein [Halobacterium salinarum]|uniref:Aminomethyltransferase C-terminal domain-containing protein n=1 Tax=Halobacterium salinarum (strain ATCC 29341 / DSM 671 / R1) TaxID=478009 RepID=B0R9A7_HALS3|nr:glycine cleavage T C-terminal barrel domain-containing protein [Halobacterium salinarum]CAP15414.2 uncharacterized protein OE_6357F [Halobacterium salinarum R1]
MTWVPAIILFGSTIFPIGYYLSSPNRTQTGRTGTISILIPLIGLLLGTALLLGSLGPLTANPLRLAVSIAGVLEVLVVVGFLTPRVIGATLGEYIANTLLNRTVVNAGYPVLVNDEVVACTCRADYDYSINAGIACAYLPTEYTDVGQSVEIEYGGGRYDATVRSSPLFNS